MACMKPGAAFYVWHADSQRANFLEACRRSGMQVRQVLVWVKNAFTLGRQDYQWRHEPCLYGWKDGAAHSFYGGRALSTVKDESDIDYESMSKSELIALVEKIVGDAQPTDLHYDKPSVSAEHPTMKPVPLIAYQVKNSSKPGDVVLDPFGGSGSTLLACEKLGRSCRTIELDPHYCDVIIQRWEDMTGEEAHLA